MKNSFWSIAIMVIWVGSICLVSYYSLQPRVEFPVDFWGADKFYHLIAYAWLALLPLLGFSKKRLAMTASLFMIVLGIALELGQRYVPGRKFSFADIAANTLGVLLGIFIGIYRNRSSNT